MKLWVVCMLWWMFLVTSVVSAIDCVIQVANSDPIVVMDKPCVFVHHVQSAVDQQWTQDVTSQMSVDVMEMGGNVLFTFGNSGPIASVIKEIYILDLNGRLTFDSIVNNPLNLVQEVEFVTESNLPGNYPWNNAATDADVGFSAASPKGLNGKGVDIGEAVGFKFAASFTDVVADIASGNIQFGIHVGSIAGAGSEKYVSIPDRIPLPPPPGLTPAPEPASVFVWVLLGVSIAVTAYRRKQKG